MSFPPVLWAFFGILIALTAPFVLWIRQESKGAGSLKSWMMDLNITTLRTLLGMFLALVVVLTNLLTNVLSIDVNIEQVEATYWFVFGMLGVDATAWIAKRATFKPEIIGQQQMGERRTVIEETVPVRQSNAVDSQPTPITEQSIPPVASLVKPITAQPIANPNDQEGA